MAKIKRAYKVESKFDATIDGETITMHFRRPLVKDYANFVAVSAALVQRIEGRPLSAADLASDDVFQSLADLIIRVDGLLDDEEQELSWSKMSAEDRYDLINSIDYDKYPPLFEHWSSLFTEDAAKKKG